MSEKKFILAKGTPPLSKNPHAFYLDSFWLQHAAENFYQYGVTTFTIVGTKKHPAATRGVRYFFAKSPVEDVFELISDPYSTHMVTHYKLSEHGMWHLEPTDSVTLSMEEERLDLLLDLWENDKPLEPKFNGWYIPRRG